MTRPDYAREVRYALRDPERLCAALGLAKGASRQASGLLVCCPSHGDRTPSCSVTTGPDGTIRVRCFACDFAGDALHLVALVNGWSTSIPDQFRDTLAEGARIAGALQLEAEILDGRPRADRQRFEAPEPIPPPEYPDAEEVAALWRDAVHPAEDVEASGYLVGRHLDPVLVGDLGLARVVRGELPEWARYGARTWLETGHRLIVRAFDASGLARGVRAIRVRDGESPKRLPPKGRKAAGLALLNRAAHAMVRRKETPARVVLVEGEPDWITRSTLNDEPVIGLVSGSWNDVFAAAIPEGCRVVIRTHEDEAGEKYARQVVASLAGKDCVIRRSASEAA